jgi:cytochrome P450
VSISLWSTFRTEDNFADPEYFYPERWLDDELDERFKNDNREAFHPFSYGPRNCLGQQ